MPAQRLPMRQVREVLRLKHAAGFSERRIAAAIGISRTTVAEYLRRARPDVLFATSIPPNLASLGGHALAKTPTAVVIRQSNVVRLTEADRYAGVRRRPDCWSDC